MAYCTAPGRPVLSPNGRGGRLSRHIGALAVVVDARDGAARRFYEHFGCRRLAEEADRLFLELAAIARRNLPAPDQAPQRRSSDPASESLSGSLGGSLCCLATPPAGAGPAIRRHLARRRHGSAREAHQPLPAGFCGSSRPASSAGAVGRRFADLWAGHNSRWRPHARQYGDQQSIRWVIPVVDGYGSPGGRPAGGGARAAGGGRSGPPAGPLRGQRAGDSVVR
jgi:hypothetical protein